MLLLPKKVGAFTLLRKLGSGGIAESYVGTHDEAGGRPVVVRRILPYVLRDPARLASIEARANDLIGVRHPFLVHVMDHVVHGDEHYIIEEYIDGVTLDKVLAWCRQAQRTIPHNVFLNIAVQVCNGLEALHARPGRGTGADSVLHLGLKPGSIFVARDGKVMVGSFGLTRSPTTLPQGGVAGPVPTRMEYLSPEQTHPDQKLTPASDIFSLGAILYELLTTESLFRADSNLQTIHKVRRAEVTSQLLRVKELMPGLDKILYRALSLNPRHRYQRSFVLREDLRGLMSGYSFASIAEDTRTFAAPLIEALVPPTSGLAAAQDAPLGADGFLDSPDTRIDPDPMTTAAITAQALQERAARERQQLGLISLDEGDGGREHTESTSPQPIEIDPPTTLGKQEQAPEDRDRPTIPGTDAAAAGVDLDRPTRPGPAVVSPAPRPIGPRRGGDLLAESTHYEALVPPSDVLEPSIDPPSVTDKDRVPAPPPAAHVSGSTMVPPESERLPGRARPGATAVPTSMPPERPREEPAAVVAPPPREPPVREAAPLPPPEPIRVAPPPEPVRVEPPRAELPPAPVAAPPPPPSMSAAPLSRPMPPPNLSRPMPGPAVGSAAPVPRPATTMDALKAAAPAPTPVPAAAPRPAAPPPPVLSTPLYDEEPEPPRGGNGLILAVAAMVGLGLVAVCAGGSWFGYSWWAARQPAPEIAAAPAAMGSDAAAMMADAAPPAVEPTVDEGVDAAAIMAAPTPVEAGVAAAEPAPPVAEPVAAPPAVAAATPTPSPRTTPAPEPERTITYEAPAPRTPPPSTRTSSSGTTSSARTSTSYEPAVVASSTPSYRSSPAPAPAPAPKAAPTKTATAAPPPAEDDLFGTTPALDVSVAETPVSTLDAYVDGAKRGQLDGSAVSTLEGVDLGDPQYTRSRALLLMNAQKKSDDAGTRKYLDQLMKLPENQYSPVYLTDYARWYVNHGEYDKAIDKASTAERYWSRLPPELVFSKKAEMYEIQAAAWQGKFYKSGGDVELLEKAILDWERYKRHVATKSRSDLAQRADTQIAKLNDIKERLE